MDRVSIPSGVRSRRLVILSEEDEQVLGVGESMSGLLGQANELPCWRTVRLSDFQVFGDLARGVSRTPLRQVQYSNLWLCFVDSEGCVLGRTLLATPVLGAAHRVEDSDGWEIDLDCLIYDPLPIGLDDIFLSWSAGVPDAIGGWAGRTAEGRAAWLESSRLLAEETDEEKQLPPVLEIDGRSIVDIDGFYCALGEAAYGPAGYFARSLYGIEERLRGYRRPIENVTMVLRSFDSTYGNVADLVHKATKLFREAGVAIRYET